jgi:hypothetical protein
MSYGDPATAAAHRWALDDDAAQPFFRQGVELSINFWDTANWSSTEPLRNWSAGLSNATPGARTSCWRPTVRIVAYIRPELAEPLPASLVTDLLQLDRVDLPTYQ